MEINKIYEQLIDEVMKGISNLPESTCLFYTPLNNNGVELNLYDPQTKYIYATISAIAPAGHTNNVSGVAARKGFGPLIYEMAMMQSSLNGKWLGPSADGDIRGEAMNVWEKFYKRADVKKETLDIEDDSFSFEILDGEESNWEPGEKTERFNTLDEEFPNTPLKEMQDDVLTFNSSYSLIPNEIFIILRNRAEKAIKNGFESQIAQSAGSKLWDEMYN